MLSANDITFRIHGKTLLDRVSADFLPGKLNLIIGPNGAGKSTFIKVISNQLRPQEGMVKYDGENVQQQSSLQLARKRAVLSQNIELVFPMTVREVVMMGRYPHFSGVPGEKDLEACRAAMALFDVQEMADRNYMTLSGGEKQRVHFARVAVQIWYPATHGCRYLLLDEPLTFLDVHYQFRFMQQVRQLLESKDLVVAGVVHDLNLAAKFADHIVLFNHGKVAAAGTAEEVLTKENIKAAYQLDPSIHTENGKLFLVF